MERVCGHLRASSSAQAQAQATQPGLDLTSRAPAKQPPLLPLLPSLCALAGALQRIRGVALDVGVVLGEVFDDKALGHAILLFLAQDAASPGSGAVYGGHSTAVRCTCCGNEPFSEDADAALLTQQGHRQKLFKPTSRRV